VNVPPSAPDVRRGSPGTTGAVSPPAAALPAGLAAADPEAAADSLAEAAADSVADAAAEADAAAAVAAAEAAVLAAGDVLVVAVPHAVTRSDATTNSNSAVRPLAHPVRSMLVLLKCTGRGQGTSPSAEASIWCRAVGL
jgi:hypothetical protein